MTEAEWLAAEHPTPLFRLIEDTASERKCVLFAVACHHLPAAYDPDGYEARKARAAELSHAVDFVDGRLSVAEIRKLLSRQGAAQHLPERGREWASGWACPPVWDFEDPLEVDVAALLREVFGNPFRPVAVEPAWLTSTVVALAEGIYQDRAFDRLPILADALQDAGCDNEDVLNHCRSDGPHVRGCWVVDLLTGRT